METTSNITTERTEFREQLQRNREMNKEQRYAKDEKGLKPYCRSVNVMGKGKKQCSQSLGARIALWKLGLSDREWCYRGDTTSAQNATHG